MKNQNNMSFSKIINTTLTKANESNLNNPQDNQFKRAVINIIKMYVTFI